MALTKNQQDMINRLLNESLEDVLSSRMEEAEGGDMESRVNDSVITDAIKGSQNLRAIATDILDQAISKFDAKIVHTIAQTLRQNGFGAVSPGDIDDILGRTHSGQYGEQAGIILDELVEKLMDHAVQQISLVVSALSDDEGA